MNSKYVDIFNKFVDEGKVEYEQVPCLCGQQKTIRIADRDCFGIKQSVVKCKKCGLVFNSPRMTEKSLKWFYGSDLYRAIYEGEDRSGHYEDCYDLTRGNTIIHLVDKVRPIDNIKSVLEVGCGGGWNLLPFVNRKMCVKGYDYSTELTSLGKNKGLDLEQGGVEDVKGSYDLIILNHVIEHFTDLFGSMKKLMSHLNDGGLVYIAIPAFDKRSLQNAHNYYFNTKSFQIYMNKCGLVPLLLRPQYNVHLSGVFRKDDLTIRSVSLYINCLKFFAYKYLVSPFVGNINKALRGVSSSLSAILKK